MKFTVYSKENGMVLFSGDGDNPEALENETRAVLLGHKKDGGWISLDGQHHDVPQRPDLGYEWDWVTKEWVDSRTIQDLKDLAHAKIESWRNKQEASGFVFAHADRQWDGGLVVRQRMQPVLNLLSLPEGFFWTDANNNDVLMSMNSLKELANAHETALVIKGFEIHAQQRAMKNALDSASSKEEVESIVIGL